MFTSEYVAFNNALLKKDKLKKNYYKILAPYFFY